MLIGALGSRDSGGAFVLRPAHLRFHILEELLDQQVDQPIEMSEASRKGHPRLRGAPVAAASCESLGTDLAHLLRCARLEQPDAACQAVAFDQAAIGVVADGPGIARNRARQIVARLCERLISHIIAPSGLPLDAIIALVYGNQQDATKCQSSWQPTEPTEITPNHRPQRWRG